MEVGDLVTEDLTQTSSVFSEMFIFDDLQGVNADFRCQRIATESGTVLSGFDVQHNISIGKYSADRHHTAAKGLAQNQDVETHAFMVTSQHLAGTGNTTLHFISHE